MTGPSFSRYVALGDSTTEGLEDPYDDGSGYRGWADRLAEALAVGNSGLRYANLAVRGRKVPSFVPSSSSRRSPSARISQACSPASTTSCARTSTWT